MKAIAGRLANAVRQSASTCAPIVASRRFASALLLSILAWELVVLLFKASARLFWCDELFTFHVSNLQPFSLLWSALRAGADGMSPGYYAIVRLARMLPGDPHVTLRLPSILGYMLTLAGVYWFARKRLPVYAALTAVVLVTLSPFRWYAVEARSYALLVGFLAISAVLWQRIGEKRFMTPLFALFLTLAVSSNHLAVVAISSFGIAELTRTILSRRLRWGVWAACLLAACPFLLSLPILLRFGAIYGKTFWARPGWGTLVSTYDDYTGLNSRLALILVVFFGIVFCDRLLWILRRSREEAPELILIGGFLFYPALLVLLTKLLNSGYTPRYGWPAILGLALGSVYLFRAIWLKPSSACLLATLLVAFAVQGGQDLKLLSKAGLTRVDARWTRLAELSRAEPGIPVVIASVIPYMVAVEYAPPDLCRRLVFVVDANTAIRLVGTDTVEKEIPILARFIPLRFEDLARFQAAHQRFILYSGDWCDWITLYLIEKHYHLSLLSKDGDATVYLAVR